MLGEGGVNKHMENLKAETVQTVQTETVLVWQVRLRNLRFKVRASAAFLAELPRLDGAWLWCGWVSSLLQSPSAWNPVRNLWWYRQLTRTDVLLTSEPVLPSVSFSIAALLWCLAVMYWITSLLLVLPTASYCVVPPQIDGNIISRVTFHCETTIKSETVNKMKIFL